MMNLPELPTAQLIPPSGLDVLASIMRLHRSKGRSLTMRMICKDIGWKSFGYILPMLRRLRQHGLIDFQDHQAATIIPKVTFIPSHMLDQLPPRSNECHPTK